MGAKRGHKKGRDCVNEINKLLAPTGSLLDVGLVFGENTVNTRILIRTARVNGDKKKPTNLVATYCPFCGGKLI